MVELKSILYESNGEQYIDQDLDNKVFEIMRKIRKERNAFSGDEERYAAGSFQRLIKYNDEYIGFVYVTKELRYTKGLFIDMALLQEYRGKGYGTEALKKYIDIVSPNNCYLIGEVTKENVASNKMASLLGEQIMAGNKNFYLFPKERIDEFLESEDIDSVRACLSVETKSTHQIIMEEKEKYNPNNKCKVKTRRD